MICAFLVDLPWTFFYLFLHFICVSFIKHCRISCLPSPPALSRSVFASLCRVTQAASASHRLLCLLIHCNTVCQAKCLITKSLFVIIAILILIYSINVALKVVTENAACLSATFKMSFSLLFFFLGSKNVWGVDGRSPKQLTSSLSGCRVVFTRQKWSKIIFMAWLF